MSARVVERRTEWSRSHLKEVRNVLVASSAALNSMDRAQAAAQVDQTRAELGLRSSVRIVVAGESNSGKTSLVNLLIGDGIEQPHPLQTTPWPIEFRHGDALRVLAVHPDGIAVSLDGTPSHTVIEQLSAKPLSHVVVETPSALLAAGMTLVDTPSLSAGLASPHAAAVLGFVAESEVLISVSDASEELGAPQAEFLDFVRMVGHPLVVPVLTKTDLYPEWPRIASANRRRLQALDVNSPVFPLSPVLAAEGALRGDKSCLRESGLDELRWYLGATLAADLAQQQTGKALATTGAVLDEARASLVAEASVRSHDDLLDLDHQLSKRTRQIGLLETGLRGKLTQLIATFRNDVSAGLDRLINDFDETTTELISRGDPGKSWGSVQSQILEAGNQLAVGHRQQIEQARDALVKELCEFAGLEAGRLGLTSAIVGESCEPTAVVGVISKSRKSSLSGFDIVRGSMGGLLTTTGTLGTAVSFASGTAVGGAMLAVAPLAVPIGMASAVWGFRSMLTKQREGDVQKARQEAREVVNKFRRDLIQEVRHTTQGIPNDLQVLLVDALNTEVPLLKAELQQEVQRIARLQEQRAGGAKPSDPTEQALGIIDQLRARVENLTIMLERPELKRTA